MTRFSRIKKSIHHFTRTPNLYIYFIVEKLQELLTINNTETLVM